MTARILAIASASGGCSAAIVQDEAVLAAETQRAVRGLPEIMPLMAARLIAQAGAPDLVAVVVGPGSFTGLRAGLALAHGLALGGMVPIVGVTVAEALAEALPSRGGRALWVAMDSRRGRIFLDRDGDLAAFALDAVPDAGGPVAVAGDAANPVAAWLAARGADVMLTSARRPAPPHVARVGLRRAAGGLHPLAPVPLYVDPPEAKLPAGGLRAAPQ
jgi:tRNA threonylcarbamoyl adenosine modification protein YeaZ